MKKLALLTAVGLLATALAATAALARPEGAVKIDANAAPAAAAPSAQAAAVPSRPNAAPLSIVETAIAVNAAGPYKGAFDTLISLLVQYPDIVATLSQKGQYTVFAPTDQAFANLFAVVPPASLTSAQVKDVLLYHVAKGRRDAADVTSSSQIRMLNGEFAAVNGATIDGANIFVTDVAASNGIIHAVDGVLLPPVFG